MTSPAVLRTAGFTVASGLGNHERWADPIMTQPFFFRCGTKNLCRDPTWGRRAISAFGRRLSWRRLPASLCQSRS